MTEVMAAAVAGVVTLLAIWLRHRLDRLDALAKPTGNGYAKATTDLLERIDARTERLAARAELHDTRLFRLERTMSDHLETKP